MYTPVHRPRRILCDSPFTRLWAPLGWLYGRLTCLWHHAYDRGYRTVTRLPVPVISVGSIFLGGSGKTPIVMDIARRLTASGARPIVLSRGYRRRERRPLRISGGLPTAGDPEAMGDEPLMIAQWTPVDVGVARSREAAYAVASQMQTYDVVLLDDGFQYRRLHRDLDMVVIDTDSWQHCRRMFPAGRLREPLHHLERSDAVLLTKWTDDATVREVTGTVRPYLRLHVPIFPVRFVLTGFYCWPEDRTVSVTEIERDASWLVTATIDDPATFLHMLSDIEIAIGAVWFRSDHARWTPGSVRALYRKARGYQGVMTTMKDWVKLRPQLDTPLRVRVALLKVEWPEPALQWMDDRIAQLLRTENHPFR